MAEFGARPAAVVRALKALEARWRRAAVEDFATARGRELMAIDDREFELHAKQAELVARMGRLIPGVDGPEPIGTDEHVTLLRAWNALERTRVLYMQRRAEMMGLDSPTLVMNVAIEEEARRLGVAPEALRERMGRIQPGLQVVN